jgi:putative transposase
MPHIMLVLAGLSHGLNATTLHRLAAIVEAMLAMTGRITMLGVSRWTESGGSYRTVQRFFNRHYRKLGLLLSGAAASTGVSDNV